MEKVIEFEGKFITVRDGFIIYPDGSRWEGRKIESVSRASQRVLAQAKTAGLDLSIRCFFAGRIVPRVLAEEALAQMVQVAKIKAAQAKAEAKAKAEALPGLAEIDGYYQARDDAQEAFSRMMESGSSRCPKPGPSESVIEDLKIKYPKAWAYTIAEGYLLSDNFSKSGAGRKAIEAIEAGEDYEEALRVMEETWSAAANQAVDNN